jgi:hypothetical protein
MIDRAKIKREEPLSDVGKSDVESDKGYDSLARQLDFVQFP